MVQIYFRSLYCFEETSEASASDEPYVLVAAVNLASSVQVSGFPVPLPSFDVARYGPFEDVDDGEWHYAPGVTQSFWGIDGRPAALNDPDQALFVVALMEHDAGRPGTLQGIVKGIVGGSILGSLALDRARKVETLIRDVSSGTGTPSGPSLDQDNSVGAPQELRFSREDLAQAESGNAVTKAMEFRGDGGHYELTFEAVSMLGLFGAIGDKWIEQGRVTGALSRPTSSETPTFDGVGRFVMFTGGIVSWHPETGAHIVWGLIGERWLQIGREEFGYPITDENPTASGDGRYNHFRAVHLPGKPEASIHWSPASGAHETYGAIRDKWASLGWEQSHLGYPVDAETEHMGGRLQRFQGGALFWTPQAGVVVQ